MTAGEKERIDKLISDIADWRVETKDTITEAVEKHRMDCLDGRLKPMQDDLSWLVANAKRREAEAAASRIRRARWYKRASVAAGGVVTLVGLMAALGFRPL
jgi:hypothetical protein